MATSAGSLAQVVPGKALGFIALGSSLHYVLSRLRSYEKVFTSISTIYDPSSPLDSPVIILLDNNGIRLRFDGTDQRLRLIEVLDFHKCRLTYNGGEFTRSASPSGGPSLKHIYHKLFGPTYPGEYVESQGNYVLSYPGVAFSYPVDKKAWKEDVDFVSLLSTSFAISMAIFSGSSWAEVRGSLFTRPVQSPRIPNTNGANARLSPANDEVECVKVHDSNQIEVVRRHNPSFFITLHATTPQDLVSEMGPPNAIYRKNDHRLSIHRARSAARNNANDDGDDTEPDDIPSEDEEDLSDLSTTSNSDCFYNYFNHGLDVFVSAVRSSNHPVATKVIIHGNVPGSYEFQRYRRCRWTVDLSASSKTPVALSIHSEETFSQITPMLRDRFGQINKPMPYSRGSDSPSSSCELLGGWEDGDTSLLEKQDMKGLSRNQTTFGDTELYGFPSLIFEVLKNKTITCLTVF
ncbi:hypothetical protein EDC01DRAFT_644763 [Geopyxis carbonaria]|nr:hypothetical protein EDC01DRAFT_644763 [Geopyxis carbonaria]